MLTDQNQKDRCGKITASAAAAIMAGGRGRAAEIERIAQEIISGEFTPTPTSSAMQFGVDNEAKVLIDFAAWNKSLGMQANLKFLQPHDNSLGIGATPDALTKFGEPIEVKSPTTTANYEKQTKTPPKKYIWQVKFQIWVMQQVGMPIKRGFLVFGDPDNIGSNHEKIEVTLPDEDGKALYEACYQARHDIQEIVNPGRPQLPSTLQTKIKTCADTAALINEIDIAAKAAIAAIRKRRDEMVRTAENKRRKPLAAVRDYCEGRPEHERPPGVRISISRKVVVDDPTQLPKEFQRVKVEADKAKIAAALAEGRKVRGATSAEEKVISVPAAPGKVENATITMIESIPNLLTNTGATQ